MCEQHIHCALRATEMDSALIGVAAVLTSGVGHIHDRQPSLNCPVKSNFRSEIGKAWTHRNVWAPAGTYSHKRINREIKVAGAELTQVYCITYCSVCCTLHCFFRFSTPYLMCIDCTMPFIAFWCSTIWLVTVSLIFPATVLTIWIRGHSIFHSDSLRLYCFHIFPWYLPLYFIRMLTLRLALCVLCHLEWSKTLCMHSLTLKGQSKQ